MTEQEGEKNRKIELGLKVSKERMEDKNTMNIVDVGYFRSTNIPTN